VYFISKDEDDFTAFLAIEVLPMKAEGVNAVATAAKLATETTVNFIFTVMDGSQV
jgi:hypothetical protein